MTQYAGVDLGATKVRAVVGTASGVAGSDRRPTPQTSGVAVTEAVLASLRAACDDAGIEPRAVAAAGVASFGPLDIAEGVVRNPANLPDEIDAIPLSGPVEQLIGGPVFLHNDATAGVIGERFHADTNPENMVYLTISSGIGAGVVVDGEVLEGWDGNVGEVGHVTVNPDGEMRCGCGRRGHWEAYCSGENLPDYARHLHDGEETALPLDSPDFDAATLFEHAGSDAFADRVIERMTAWNVQGVAAVVHAYAPLVICVGGAVALNNPELVVEALDGRIEGEVVSNVPEIRLSTLGEDVVVRGALASAMTGGTGDASQL